MLSQRTITPDKQSEISKEATAAYHKINRKPPFIDIIDFYEKAKAMLVEMSRDADVEKTGCCARVNQWKNTTQRLAVILLE